MFELFEKLKCTKVIGFTCGTFDLLHAGHVMMLEESKAHCDYLIVGLLSDPTISRPSKNKPIESMWERYVRLQSIKVIDYIIPWDTEEDLENMLQMIQPSIRFVGEEYLSQQFTGRELCKKLGIEIYFNRRSHKYSSTELRSRPEMPRPSFEPGGVKYKPHWTEIIEQQKPKTFGGKTFIKCIDCKGECSQDSDCIHNQDFDPDELRDCINKENKKKKGNSKFGCTGFHDCDCAKCNPTTPPLAV